MGILYSSNVNLVVYKHTFWYKFVRQLHT